MTAFNRLVNCLHIKTDRHQIHLRPSTDTNALESLIAPLIRNLKLESG